MFLDVNVCHKNGKFVTSVYKKPTFSWVFTNYESLFPPYHKSGLYHILLCRNFSICCDFKTFHFEINHLKAMLRNNNCPQNFIDFCIKSFFHKLHTPKVIAQKVPKKDVFIKLSFFKSISFKFERSLKTYFVINWCFKFKNSFYATRYSQKFFHFQG